MDLPASDHVLRIDLVGRPPFLVGGALVDPLSREASYVGGSERLQPQTVKVLIALIDRAGGVVTREELIDRCWDGRFVGDDVINRAILLCRKFAQRAGGFGIETVPKAGYRLVGRGFVHKDRPFRAILAAAIAAVVFLIVGAGLWLRPPAGQGKPPTPTVALLPLTSEPGASLAGDIAVATRTSLGHMLADSGFTPWDIPSLPPGSEAAADFVISGDLRRSGKDIEATVRLTETRHGTVIYSKRFSAPTTDSAALPDRIGAQLSTNLSWTGALMVLDRRHPLPPRIAAELLKQMAMTVEGEDLLRAYEISRQIAPQAPDSAIAQVALAFNTGFVFDQIPHDQRQAALVAGRRAAARAQQLAPDFGDAYVPPCLLRSPVRIIECEQDFRAGLGADPDAPFVTAFLGTLLHGVGRNVESLQLARLALANDPYKPSKLARVVRFLEASSETDEAEALYRKSIRWWPGNRSLIWSRFAGMIERNDFEAADRFVSTLSADFAPFDPKQLSGLAKATRMRDAAAARRICPPDVHSGPICMIALANLGDLDTAFAISDRIYLDLRASTPAGEDRLLIDHPNGPPLSFLTSSAGAALRRDARFVALADRVGLLRYWRSGRLPDFCREKPEPVCAVLAGRS